jgi:hypothetical protein
MEKEEEISLTPKMAALYASLLRRTVQETVMERMAV